MSKKNRKKHHQRPNQKETEKSDVAVDIEPSDVSEVIDQVEPTDQPQSEEKQIVESEASDQIDQVDPEREAIAESDESEEQNPSDQAEAEGEPVAESDQKDEMDSPDQAEQTPEESVKEDVVEVDAAPAKKNVRAEAIKRRPTRDSDKKNKKGESLLVDEELPPSEDSEPPTPPVESPEQAKAILECLLFTTTEPLSMKKLKRILWSLDDAAILNAIDELDKDMEPRGLQVREVAGGWLMATRGQYSDWVMALHKNKKRRALTKAMLETLAIVAYRQPLIKAEIDSIRGVDSGGVLRGLVDLDIVDARDRREIIGRPLQYRTTKVFLKAFGLNSLSDLPSIGELRNLYKKREQLELPERSTEHQEDGHVESANEDQANQADNLEQTDQKAPEAQAEQGNPGEATERTEEQS